MPNVVALAVQCGLLLVDQSIMDAIVRVESRGNPYALAVNGEMELVREPHNREEAVAMARWLDEHGYNFDAGLGQVNSANLARLGLDVSTVFDPCANLRAASRILNECYERALKRVGGGERAITAAVSCYNTGHLTNGVAGGYVNAVRASATGPLVVRPRKSENARRTQARSRRVGPHGVFAQQTEAFAKPVADVFALSKQGE